MLEDEPQTQSNVYCSLVFFHYLVNLIFPSPRSTFSEPAKQKTPRQPNPATTMFDCDADVFRLMCSISYRAFC